MSVWSWGGRGALLIACAALGQGDGRVGASEHPAGAPGVRGAGSCAAAACHGAVTPSGGPVLRNEYFTWISRDPHADAAQTLFSARSQAIARRVGHGRAAHEDGRCLACHATATAAPLLQDGVGCESCHGPADKWLGPHTTFEWDCTPAQIKEERFGMVATKDLGRRIEVCAGCHVGAPARDGQPARDVDHDLIAAGHPRLNFEFSAYLANLPAHWVEKGRNAAGDLPARAWALGQVVSARAALELLHARATRAHSTTWPEFSEYDCASCHHDLRLSGERSTGAPHWGSWYYPLTGAVAQALPGPDAQPFEAGLQRLRATLNAPDPSREQTASQADEAARLLGRWARALGSETFDPPKVQTLIRAVETTPAPGRSRWDHDAQQYLALVPLRQALVGPDRDEPRLFQEIQSLRVRLLVPEWPAANPLPNGPHK